MSETASEPLQPPVELPVQCGEHAQDSKCEKRQSDEDKEKQFVRHVGTSDW